MLIDGAHGEGGGQILRTGLAMAAVLGRAVRIVNIRKGRRTPGLQAQHLTAVRAMATITGGQVEGDSLGSTEVTFRPRELTGGSYEFDVASVRSSAGSVGLIFQCVAPALFFAKGPSRLQLRGGTHVPWSPSTTYLERVFLPILRRMGLEGELRTERWGWYPRGGGVAEAEIRPAGAARPLELLERGKLLAIDGLSAVSNLPLSIARRQREQFLRRLSGRGVAGDIRVTEAPSIGHGSFILARATYERAIAGFSALGELGKPAERVADEAFEEFEEYEASGHAVDKYLGDQILPYVALSRGASCFTVSRITQHLITNSWVIERLLPVRFEIEGALGGPGRVAVFPLDFDK